jgi:hypothetical protein
LRLGTARILSTTSTALFRLPLIARMIARLPLNQLANVVDAIYDAADFTVRTGEPLRKVTISGSWLHS